MNGDILIVGADGFLGTALSRRLMDEGRTVHRLLRRPAAASGELNAFRLEDDAMLRRILPGCGTVFHLASATTPGSSAHHPALEAGLNLQPTLQLIETLQHFPHLRLVFVSSGGTLYGNPATAAVEETAPLAPLSYHGAGKLAIETFLHTFHQLNGAGVTVLRPSNLYGPGQSLRDGFGLIRTLLEHARRGTTMQIWGDGESVRDFLYIDDIVDACMRVLQRGSGGWEVFNVGAGAGHSVNQIKGLVEAVVGRPLSAIYQPSRPGDVRRIVLDCSKLRSESGWNPAMPLDEGIRLTWQWLQNK